MSAFDRWFWPVLFWIQVAAQLGLSFGRAAQKRDDDAAERAENSKCALRGLVLLRGQLGEYVCVTPGSERGRRKP
jgi:hypothetical protein